jgi:hypothetical protein
MVDLKLHFFPDSLDHEDGQLRSAHHPEITITAASLAVRVDKVCIGDFSDLSIKFMKRLSPHNNTTLLNVLSDTSDSDMNSTSICSWEMIMTTPLRLTSNQRLSRFKSKEVAEGADIYLEKTGSFLRVPFFQIPGCSALGHIIIEKVPWTYKTTPNHRIQRALSEASMAVFKTELVLSPRGPQTHRTLKNGPAQRCLVPKKDGKVRWVSDFRATQQIHQRRIINSPHQ